MGELSAGRLMDLIQYEPETGEFTWRVRRSNKAAGSRAGNLNLVLNYVQIRIDNVLYYAHRLAWLYMTGEWPASQVDHRDLDGSNNRWDNLREANRAQNNHNRPLRKNNTSGGKGAFLIKKTGRWTSEIQLDGVKYRLGRYDTKEEAHAAYRAASERLHGEFARVK